MSTTSLFIEILLTGIQAAIWIVLVIFCVIGLDWIALEQIQGFETTIAVLLLPIVYPLGIVIDYLSDAAFKRKERKIRAEFITDPSQSAMDLVSRNKDTLIANHLNYLRSRIRISRASAVNLCLILIFGTVFIIFRCRELFGFFFWRILFIEFVMGLLFSVSLVYAWSRLTRSFFAWVAKGYNANFVITDANLLDDLAPNTLEASSDVPRSTE